MYRIGEAVRKADVAALLYEMRSWLNINGCSAASLATSRETSDIMLIEVDFDYLDRANAFLEAFQGRAVCPALVSEPR